MIPPFTLHRAQSVEEACALLSRYGDDAKLLAGGSELNLLLKLGLIRPGHIIDIKRIPSIARLDFDAERKTLAIGALVTHGDLVHSESIRTHFPLLAAVERQVANVRIRNVGTVAGNLCFAEPHADPGTLLAAYGARVKIRGADKERILSVSEFFTDYYETALGGDEILTEIEVPKLGENFTGAYLRFCPGERPTAAAAVMVGWGDAGATDVRIVLGCVGPTPIAASGIARGLVGRSPREMILDVEEIGAAAGQLCDPVEDVWGSKEYKRHVVKTLVSRALTQVSENWMAR